MQTDAEKTHSLVPGRACSVVLANACLPGFFPLYPPKKVYVVFTKDLFRSIHLGSLLLTHSLLLNFNKDSSYLLVFKECHSLCLIMTKMLCFALHFHSPCCSCPLKWMLLCLFCACFYCHLKVFPVPSCFEEDSVYKMSSLPIANGHMVYKAYL